MHQQQSHSNLVHCIDNHYREKTAMRQRSQTRDTEGGSPDVKEEQQQCHWEQFHKQEGTEASHYFENKHKKRTKKRKAAKNRICWIVSTLCTPPLLWLLMFCAIFGMGLLEYREDKTRVLSRLHEADQLKQPRRMVSHTVAPIRREMPRTAAAAAQAPHPFEFQLGKVHSSDGKVGKLSSQEGNVKQGTKREIKDTQHVGHFTQVASLPLMQAHSIVKTKTPSRPEVVWLMSFPNSGTSYTLANIKSLTGCTIGSNYGKSEWGAENAVRYRGGPYVERGLPLPQNSLLTKTHCGGYKMRHNLFDPHEADFRSSCGKGYDAASLVAVRKAIHLIRNPFDNLISRMHNKINQLIRKQRSKSEKQRIRQQFPSTRQGFLHYCRTFVDDHRGNNQWFNHRMKTIKAHKLPCAAEWFRYVMWHNRALASFHGVSNSHRTSTSSSLVATIEQVHRVYYESYTTAFNATVDRMVDFLNLPLDRDNAVTHPFDGGNRTYLHMYTRSEFEVAKQLVQEFATPECWMLIQHYFGPMYKQQCLSHP